MAYAGRRGLRQFFERNDYSADAQVKTRLRRANPASAGSARSRGTDMYATRAWTYETHTPIVARGWRSSELGRMRSERPARRPRAKTQLADLSVPKASECPTTNRRGRRP